MAKLDVAIVGHDAVAIADARAALSKVQLEPADILRRRRVQGSLQKRLQSQNEEGCGAP